MRLFELKSQYIGELTDTIIDLIYTSSAEGKDSISTKDLVDDLAREGYMVDVHDLIDLLKGNPIVTNISQDSIDIDTGINKDQKASSMAADAQARQQEKNKSKVAAMAKKQMNRNK